MTILEVTPIIETEPAVDDNLIHWGCCKIEPNDIATTFCGKIELVEMRKNGNDCIVCVEVSKNSICPESHTVCDFLVKANEARLGQT